MPTIPKPHLITSFRGYCVLKMLQQATINFNSKKLYTKMQHNMIQYYTTKTDEYIYTK